MINARKYIKIDTFMTYGVDKLRIYLIKEGLSITEFAEIINIQRTYLYRMMYGFQRFSDRVAGLIEDQTKGRVTYFSLRGKRRKKKRKTLKIRRKV